MTATLDHPAAEDLPAGSSIGTAVAVGELRTIALASDAAPPQLGGRYRRIVAGAVDDAGGAAVAVELADSTTAAAVLLLADAGGAGSGGGGAGGGAGAEPVVVARVGDAAPGGGRYRAFRELDLADGGQLLFRAELDGGAAAEGLFLRTCDGVHAVARAGGGGATTLSRAEYAAFAQPTLVATGAAPSIAFVARLVDGRTCVVQHPSYQDPTISLCSGVQLGENEVVEDDLVISRLGMGLCCVARVRSGERRFTKAFVVTSSVVSSGAWLQTGAELPGHGRIARLLTPPAVCAQLGFVTVGLDDGRMALCIRPPALADPTVVLSSGDAVPGLPGETVRRIGAPVASSSAARQLPFGVASTIRLSDGRPALWVGVFAGQAPVEGAAIVPWLGSERAADRPELGVSRLSPVKLGNDGTLLLRAVVGNTSERRTSLLTLPGLFDWFAAGASSP